MKIIRNNETIKLTPEELLLAYEEQQLLFYMQDIRKRAEHLGISDVLSDESCLAIAERFVPDADSNARLNRHGFYLCTGNSIPCRIFSAHLRTLEAERTEPEE